jgi:hypothetical protein
MFCSPCLAQGFRCPAYSQDERNEPVCIFHLDGDPCPHKGVQRVSRPSISRPIKIDPEHEILTSAARGLTLQTDQNVRERKPPMAKQAPICKCGCGRQVTERYQDGKGGWKTYFSDSCPRKKPGRQTDEEPKRKRPPKYSPFRKPRRSPSTNSAVGETVEIPVSASLLDGFWAKLAIADKARIMMQWITGVVS